MNFLRKFCVISTLDSRVILHSNAHRLGKELQQNSAVCATTLAEFTQLLCARRAENFRRLCNFFARIRRKICVTPMLDAFFFGSECNTDSINSKLRFKVRAAHAGRMHAIFVRGGVADFRKICKFFARILRKLGVISTLDSRVILHENPSDSGKSCDEVLWFVQPRWPSSRNFCARGASKFFGT